VNRTSMRRALVPTVAALTLGFGLTACNSSNGAGGDSLAGSGSSAQQKAETAWIAGYQTQNTSATVTYDPIGSGDGRKNFESGASSYAGSDSYLVDDEGELTAAKTQCGGEDPIEVPAYVSPIAVAFNLDGVTSLDLSAETIAKIFNGTITKWNDPAIAEDNTGVTLPDADIVTVHRSDDSGTTKNFTDYLSKAGNGAWADDADSLWPSTLTGEAAEGTSGVIGVLTDTPNSIGYADHSAVGDLGVASIEVGKDYVVPSAETAAKALEVSKPVSGRPAVDMAYDIDRTTTKAGAYPLILVSYLLACQHYSDATTADLVKGFLSYAVSAEGQQAGATAAGSAPLPTSIQTKAAAIVGAIAAK
jgi:phosphate transport system substrate-binding protein